MRRTIQADRSPSRSTPPGPAADTCRHGHKPERARYNRKRETQPYDEFEIPVLRAHTRAFDAQVPKGRFKSDPLEENAPVSIAVAAK